MAFFDDVGKKIASTSQGAVQKTKIIAETVRLNNMISNEGRNINNAYLQVGKLYYETYGADPDQLFLQLIAVINDSKSKIFTYSEQIKQCKGVVNCPKCGAEVSSNGVICNSCGSATNNPFQEVKPIVSGVPCQNCGAQMPADMIFCTNCGKKIPEQSATENIEEQNTQTNADVDICAACGIEFEKSAIFCPGCGKKIKELY